MAVKAVTVKKHKIKGEMSPRSRTAHSKKVREITLVTDMTVTVSSNGGAGGTKNTRPGYDRFRSRGI